MTFYKTLSKYYDVLFPSNENQINFIQSYVSENSKIFDVAAGTGNQAIRLAQLGYQVTATDLDEEMIEQLNRKIRSNDIAITAYSLDMRNIDALSANSFNSVLCIGNSIVHLDSITEIKQTLLKMYNLLTESGTVIIQVVNYDKVLQQKLTKLPIIERKEEGVTFIRTYEHEEKRVKFNGKLVVKGEAGESTFENSLELYPLTSNELVDALEQAGFHSINLFGNFNKDTYQGESPAIIAVAHKR